LGLPRYARSTVGKSVRSFGFRFFGISDIDTHHCSKSSRSNTQKCRTGCRSTDVWRRKLYILFPPSLDSSFLTIVPVVPVVYLRKLPEQFRPGFALDQKAQSVDDVRTPRSAPPKGHYRRADAFSRSQYLHSEYDIPDRVRKTNCSFLLERFRCSDIRSDSQCRKTSVESSVHGIHIRCSGLFFRMGMLFFGV
jgi:hypothetical protein